MQPDQVRLSFLCRAGAIWLADYIVSLDMVVGVVAEIGSL
jgi:hypothetical protein